MSLPERFTAGMRDLASQMSRVRDSFTKRAALRRRQSERAISEAERLDRIRNPDKYRGR